MRKQRDELQEEIVAQRESERSLSRELDDLRSERDQLRNDLSAAEQRVEAAGGVEDQSEEVSALWQRIELAMEEIHELRQKNEELEHQLSKADSTPSSPPSFTSAQDADWETQKQMLLNQLESEGESDDEEVQEERLKINDTIRVTNHAIAKKDKEIDELRSLLSQQSDSIAGVAVGAAAIEEALTQDELIQQERGNLRQLQDEWHEKMRQAEIEISTERAKLARERLSLEEKLRTYEQSRPNGNGDDDDDDTVKSGSRRGWLSRLGLSESED